MPAERSGTQIRHTTLRRWARRDCSIALIHLLDSIGKYNETRYVFWMYVGLMIASLAVAGWLLVKGTRAAWLAAGALSLSVLAGFVLSRTTGLPNATGDVGNWTEPLGLASMFVEGAVVILAGYAWALVRHERLPACTHPSPPGRRRALTSGSAVVTDHICTMREAPQSAGLSCARLPGCCQDPARRAGWRSRPVLRNHFVGAQVQVLV